MKSSEKKRAPHGVTSALVFDALAKLQNGDDRRGPVSRVELLNALRLPETTVDDRLRVLVKQGRVERIRRAVYMLKPQRSW